MKYLIFAAVLLTGCSNTEVTIDKALGEARQANAMAIAAATTANEAKTIAEEAKALAVEANVTSNDAVEAVSRMAEKCCRK